MDETALYTTPEQVLSFMQTYPAGRRFSFIDCLERMRRQGLLSETPPPMPELSGAQSQEDFLDALQRVPILATDIVKKAPVNVKNRTEVEEDSVLPPDRDIISMQHLFSGTQEFYFSAFFEITLVCQGCFHMRFNDQDVSLGPGDICIVSPGTLRSNDLAAGSSAILLLVRSSTFDLLFSELTVRDDPLSSFFRESLYGERRFGNYLQLSTDPEDRRLRWYLQTLVRETYTDDPFSNMNSVSLLKLLLATAFRTYGDNARTFQSEGKGRRSLDCATLLRYIQLHYRNVTLSGLASDFHYDCSYLSRLLLDYTGQSFTDLLRNIRMNRAREYLQNTELKVSEIADLVGYQSTDHFTRTFKAIYGQSPRDWRTAMKHDGS